MKYIQKDFEALIYYAKSIIRAKASLKMLNETKFLLSRSNAYVPSAIYLTNVETEIQLSIKYMRKNVAKLMNLLLKDSKITIGDEFQISASELKDGYCELLGSLTFDKRNGMPTGPSRRIIFFLTDYEDAFHTIKKADVYKFEEVKDILTKLEPLIDISEMVTNSIIMKNTK